jgi:hypothetical protein
MTDLDVEQPATDDMATDADGGTVELALRLAPPESWAMVFALVKIAADPRTTKRNLRALHDSLAATAQAQRQLETYRTEHDAQLAKDRAELAAERDVLTKRQVAAHQAEASLEERTERIRKLELAWSGLTLPGEPPPLMGTLSRSKAYSGLERARYAAEHGGALPRHPDAEPDESTATVNYDSPPAPVRRGHGDSGDWPANVSMTKEPAEPAAGAAGARVRARRGVAHAE